MTMTKPKTTSDPFDFSAKFVPEAKTESWDDLLAGEFTAKRAKVDDVDVADGGYLTWLYGSSTARMGAWPPEFAKKAIVFMDSRKNNRRDRSPHYKQGRIDRRNSNEKADVTYQLVKGFQEMIVEDPRITFISHPGCEADDLVAIAAWKWGTADEPLRVFGRDKDLLQIGSYFSMVEKDGEDVTLEHFHEGLPKALQNAGPLEAWQIPIVLALLGDKSDSVPRFLPRGPSGLRILAEMLWGTDKPWDEFLRQFPEAVPNLFDVLLPDPFLFGLAPEDCIPLLKENRWQHDLLRKLDPKLKKKVMSWRLLR
jgi:hypothetical protein